jgi:hypothetical protein
MMAAGDGKKTGPKQPMPNNVLKIRANYGPKTGPTVGQLCAKNRAYYGLKAVPTMGQRLGHLSQRMGPAWAKRQGHVGR